MLTQARYGKMVVVDNDPIASRSLQVYGEWAQNELDVLHRFIRPGMTVVDGGAYVGSHTLAFADFVGPTGRVHSFEAYPEFFGILLQNVRANHCDAVVCHAYALSDREAMARVPAIGMDVTTNFGGSSFLQAAHAPGTAGGEVGISFGTLDGLVTDKVDFIKLDVEGMECLALLGARAILAQSRPVVFTECNSIHEGVAVLQLMEQAGYVGFGCLTPAFNPQNFNANRSNMFGDAKESGLIFIHATQVPEFEATVADLGLPRLDRLDDLGLLLYHKPQYPTEILAASNTGRTYGLDYPSPLAASLTSTLGDAGTSESLPDRLARTDAALAETQEMAVGRAREIDDLSARLATTDAALAEMQALAIARAHEIDAVSARLSTTEAALAEVQALALARAQEIDDLSGRLSTTDAAFAEVQGLALARAQELGDLSGRLAATDAALAETQALAVARADRIDELSAQLSATNAAHTEAEALATVRAREIEGSSERLLIAEKALAIVRVQLANTAARLADTEVAFARATWWWRWMRRRR